MGMHTIRYIGKHGGGQGRAADEAGVRLGRGRFRTLSGGHFRAVPESQAVSGDVEIVNVKRRATRIETDDVLLAEAFRVHRDPDGDPDYEVTDG